MGWLLRRYVYSKEPAGPAGFGLLYKVGADYLIGKIPDRGRIVMRVSLGRKAQAAKKILHSHHIISLQFI